jgi:hypothetical protein
VNTIEWLQALVEDLEADIRLRSEDIKRTEELVSYWTNLKEARQQKLDDYIKIQQQLSLIIDQMILAETSE